MLLPSFASSVFPQVPRIPSGILEGFCYLTLVEDSHRDAARVQLQAFPTRAALTLFFEKDPDAKSRGFFSCKFTRPPGLGKFHTVVHVEPTAQHQSALTVEEILAIVPPFSVFGLDPTQVSSAAVPMAPAAPPTPDTGMYLTASGFPSRPQIKLFAKLTNDEHVVFSPTTNSTLRTMLLMFESARIEEVSMDFFVAHGKSNHVMLAVSTNSSTPSEFFAEPIFTRVGGSDLGPVERSWVLPPNSFGKEIRAASLGNPPPHFHFKAKGSSSFVAVVRVYLTLSLAGFGVIPAIDIGNSRIPVPATLASIQNNVGGYNLVSTD